MTSHLAIVDPFDLAGGAQVEHRAKTCRVEMVDDVCPSCRILPSGVLIFGIIQRPICGTTRGVNYSPPAQGTPWLHKQDHDKQGEQQIVASASLDD
ncbi:hypothetical protein [Erythrobacter sp.]|uniref:hypothetical protein n=1 Tax=Erythrobacter sp. TaxID=1042 RepID=UPI00311D5CD6